MPGQWAHTPNARAGWRRVCDRTFPASRAKLARVRAERVCDPDLLINVLRGADEWDEAVIAGLNKLERIDGADLGTLLARYQDSPEVLQRSLRVIGRYDFTGWDSSTVSKLTNYISRTGGDDTVAFMLNWMLTGDVDDLFNVQFGRMLDRLGDDDLLRRMLGNDVSDDIRDGLLSTIRRAEHPNTPFWAKHGANFQIHRGKHYFSSEQLVSFEQSRLDLTLLTTNGPIIEAKYWSRNHVLEDLADPSRSILVRQVSERVLTGRPVVLELGATVSEPPVGVNTIRTVREVLDEAGINLDNVSFVIVDSHLFTGPWLRMGYLESVHTMDMAVYECSDWQGLRSLLVVLDRVGKRRGLMPVERPPDGRADSDWHQVLEWGEFHKTGRRIWEQSEEKFKRWQLPHSPIKRATMYFRVPFLEREADPDSLSHARVLSVVATSYQDGFVGVGFSITVGERIGINESSVDRDGREMIGDLYSAFSTRVVESLGPSYLWVSGSNDKLERLDKPEVQARELSVIYWTNYFGPPYVEKYGLDLLLAAPGWKKEKLADGGVFYQLGPKFTDPEGAPDREEVLSYFEPAGVKHVAWPHDELIEGRS